MAFFGARAYHLVLLCLLLVTSLHIHGLLKAVEAQRSVSDVRSTYHIYNPRANNYELAGLYCATWDSDQSYQWRSEYKWTAYCADGGPPMGESLCGKCLRVSNPDTEEVIVVRIVDECANGGLDLEQDAFNAIDGDGHGYVNGHMFVDITFVNC